MPAALIALARLNRPSIFVYGGTILPGCITGQRLAQRLARSESVMTGGKFDGPLDIMTVFEAVGARAVGLLFYF